MWKQDPQRLALQAIGLLAAVASILYFIFSNSLDLSPFTTAVVGLLLSIGLAAASIRATEPWNTVSLYVLSGVAFLGGSFRLVQTYSLGDVGALAAMLVVAVVALGVSQYRDRLPTPSRNAARIVVLVAVVLSVALVGLDVGTSDVTTSYETVDRVTVPSSTDPEVTVGAVTFTNPSPLPREAGYLRIDGCLVGANVTEGRGEIGVNVQQRSNALLPGGGQKTVAMTTYIHEERTNETSFVVVQTDRCPETASEPTIAIYEPPDRRYY